MANKPFNTRIQLKHDTEAHWNLAVNFVPLASELIVYDPDSTYTYSRFKIGDGTTNVNNLPFVTQEAAQKSVDTSISTGSTSTNLPTSAAVASYVQANIGGGSTIVTTTNSTASDTLTCSDNITLSNGQLVFVFLNKATVGTNYMTISFNGGTAIDIYLTGSTKMQASFGEGSILGLFYNSGNLYMINPPIAV